MRSSIGLLLLESVCRPAQLRISQYVNRMHGMTGVRRQRRSISSFPDNRHLLLQSATWFVTPSERGLIGEAGSRSRSMAPDAGYA